MAFSGLVKAFLEQGVLDGLEEWTPEQGTPQGAVCSPLPSDALRPVISGPQSLAQTRQIGVQIAGLLRNRDMIHPAAPRLAATCVNAARSAAWG